MAKKKTSKKKTSKTTRAPKIIEAVIEPDHPLDAGDESNYEDPDQMTIGDELDDQLDDELDDPKIIEADEQRDRAKDRAAEEAAEAKRSRELVKNHRVKVRKAVAGAAIRSISNAMYSSSMVSLIAAEVCDDGKETKDAIRAIVGPIVSDLELELAQ